MPSPTAASLGKYGFTQVAYYTGMPQVSVPLWEAKGSQLSLPITLNYNNNGLKVTEEASWVGLGWSLQAGGVITQNIRGYADEFLGHTTQAYTYEQLSALTDNQRQLNLVGQSYADGSPDFFIFNFGSYTGKFFFYQGNIYQFAYSDLKISYDSQASTFTVVTGDGTTYRFTKRETTTVHPYTAYPYGATVPPSAVLDSYSYSWLLTEVVSADLQDVITLTYDDTTPETIRDPMTIAGTGTTGYRFSHSWQGTIQMPNGDIECTSSGYGIDAYSTSGSQSTAISYRLKQIETQRERIVFVPRSLPREDINGTAYALQQIDVYDKLAASTTPIRTLGFTTSYFGVSGLANTPRYARLRLDGLYESGPSRASKPGHQFSYYERNSSFPDKAGYNMDHWGYFNNANNASLIPATTHHVNGTANRTPNLAAAQFGVLRQITYPTSGAETFYYEPNEFNDGTGIKTGPGIRVQKIATKAANGTLSYRAFRYTPKVNYWLLPEYEHVMTANPGTRCDCQLAMIDSPNPDIFSIFGSTVYYPVIEELSGLNGENGRTIYTYASNGSERWGNGMNLTKKVMQTATGDKVKEEEYLYQDGGGYSGLTLILILHTQMWYNHYSAGSRMLYSLPGLFRRDYGCVRTAENCGTVLPPLDYKHDTDFNINMNYYYPTFESLSPSWVHPTRKTERFYAVDNGQVYTETTNYSYGHSTLASTDPAFHRYLTQEEKVVNQDQTRLTLLRYPQDYSTSSAAGQDVYYNAVKRMQELHIVNQPIETLSALRTGTTTTILGGQLTLFKEFYPNIVKPEKVLALETTTPLASGVFSAVTGATFAWDSHYVPRVQYTYNATGQLTEWQKNQLRYSVIWDNVSNLMAKVQNAPGGTSAFTSFEPDALGGWSYETSTGASAHRRQDDSRAGQWVYRLDAGWGVGATVPTAGEYELVFWAKSDQFILYANGVPATNNIKAQAVVATGPNGWQQFRLQLQLPANCALNLDASSASTPVVIDEVRLHPVGAQMTSYTHAPLIGLTSQTDPSGRLTSYSYDFLGRLGTVRNEKGQTVTQVEYIYAR